MKKLLIIALFLAALTCPAFSQSDDSSSSSTGPLCPSAPLTLHAKAFGYGLEWDRNFGWVSYSGSWAYVYIWGTWNYMGCYNKNGSGAFYDYYLGWEFIYDRSGGLMYDFDSGLYFVYYSGLYPYRVFYVYGYGWSFEQP